MVKAVYHKHQRVFVKPVGTWAVVEQVKPQWVKDVSEPLKVHYDCGLGRDFSASELSAEEVDDPRAPVRGQWRLVRAKNRWQLPDECGHHPYPGTFPVVVTDEKNWGGWRTPGAEYDRDPERIEAQGRLIAQAPRLLALVEEFTRQIADDGEVAPEMTDLARRASDIIRLVHARAVDADADLTKASTRGAKGKDKDAEKDKEAASKSPAKKAETAEPGEDGDAPAAAAG